MKSNEWWYKVARLSKVRGVSTAKAALGCDGRRRVVIRGAASPRAWPSGPNVWPPITRTCTVWPSPARMFHLEQYTLAAGAQRIVAMFEKKMDVGGLQAKLGMTPQHTR